MPATSVRIAGELQKALDTVAGMKRQAQIAPGYMLCEDTRSVRQEWRSRFIVRPHDPNNIPNLLVKGIHIVTTGEPGPDLNPEPLLRKAAAETDDPERKELLLAEAAKCIENMTAADRERKAKKPTMSEIQAAREMAQTQVIAQGMREGLRDAFAAMQEAAPQKRGPGRPRKDEEE